MNTRQIVKSLSSDQVRYGLRFQILPDARAISRAREVVAFCRQHRIHEVHLFFNAEEWNRGHVTEAEIKALLAMFRRIIPILRAGGLAVNVNPWSTTLHCDRGRSLRAVQRFDVMVSPSGRKARAVASFACPRWRAYMASLFGRLAEVGFETLWLEDDWRYHNHAPLDWGGDFSGAMIRRFSAAIGKPVTRDALVRAVLKPGRPHPWRARWMATWRDAQLEATGLIRDAVRRANPRARLGLMSSHPDVHAAEGRDWARLFDAMAIDGQAVHRPHFAGYSESTGDGLYQSYIMLDAQKRLRPARVESHPEIENYPFGRFNKSDAMTFAQMALSKVMGSEGLLLDLHPMTGNSVLEEKGMGELLSRAYPALDWLSRRFPRAMESHGVGVPFVPDAAAHTRLTAGAGYGALPILFNAPMMILGGLGVATQGGVSPGVNVLWGEQAWAFSDEAITDLLSKGLWLDARAASILIERGFGRHIGIKPGRWLDRESALYALERFMHSHTGVRRGFNASVNLAPRLLTFEAVAGAETWTEIVDCMNRRLGAGLCVFNNAKGGRVAVTAYNLANNGIAYRNWYLGFQRQTLVHRLVGALAGRSVPVMAEGAPHALTIEQRLDADRAVVVINGWPDPIAAGSMRVNIPGAKRVRESVLIAPLRAPCRIPARTSRSGNGLAVMPGADMPYLGMWVLRAG